MTKCTTEKFYPQCYDNHHHSHLSDYPVDLEANLAWTQINSLEWIKNLKVIFAEKAKP